MTTITIHSFDDDTTPHAISLVSVLGLTLDWLASQTACDLAQIHDPYLTAIAAQAAGHRRPTHTEAYQMDGGWDRTGKGGSRPPCLASATALGHHNKQQAALHDVNNVCACSLNSLACSLQDAL